MIDIFDKFNSLSKRMYSDGFIVADIPNLQNHKIGSSPENYPIFFIKCKDLQESVLDSFLEMIKIEFSKECVLHTNANKEEGIYTLVTLKSEIETIQRYFIDIMYLILKKMPVIPTVQNIRQELNMITEIFRNFGKPPTKSIQGVWAEMLVIESSINVDYLVSSWHSTIYSKFDFNDGIDKLEIKSTLKDRRIHSFSISQLYKNPSSNLVIGSIMTSCVGNGVTVLNLRDMIFNKLINKSLISKVDEILSKTLGKFLENSEDYSFDYNSAVDSLRFFDSEDIPTILGGIPIEISNIKFDCDISQTPFLTERSEKSMLLNSLNFKNI